VINSQILEETNILSQTELLFYIYLADSTRPSLFCPGDGEETVWLLSDMARDQRGVAVSM